MKHPKHQDFVQQQRATKQPKGDLLDAILESASIASETILAKRLEALYQRLLTLRARAVRYRMTDRGERAPRDAAQPCRRCMLVGQSGVDRRGERRQGLTAFDPSLVWKVEAGWRVRDLRWVLGFWYSPVGQERRTLVSTFETLPSLV